MDSMTRSNMCKTFWLAKRVLCLSSTICPFNYEGWTPCVIDISDWRWLYHYFFTCHPTDQVSGTSITTMRGSHRNTHTCQTLPRPVQCSGCRRRQRHGWLHPQRDLLRLIAGWKRSVILPVWFSSCPIFFSTSLTTCLNACLSCCLHECVICRFYLLLEFTKNI